MEKLFNYYFDYLHTFTIPVLGERFVFLRVDFDFLDELNCRTIACLLIVCPPIFFSVLIYFNYI